MRGLVWIRGSGGIFAENSIESVVEKNVVIWKNWFEAMGKQGGYGIRKSELSFGAGTPPSVQLAGRPCLVRLLSSPPKMSAVRSRSSPFH